MNGAKPCVLVLMGGPDAEREVSICSGRAIAQALRDGDCFDVIEQVIDKPDEDEIRCLECDVVFPALHGSWGEGGPLQNLLERVGRPFVGSSSAASALAMDKMRTKVLLARAGVPTPIALELSPDDPCRIEPPLVLKPIDDGSSVDIRICYDRATVTEARAQLHVRRKRLMAEQYIPGRELTVGIISGRVLPIIEIRPGVAFYDFEAKYERSDTEYLINPDLAPDVAESCNRHALTAWERIGCRDLARVDFRLDADDRLWFLEINTMPGFTSHSLVPLAAEHAGQSMSDLCESLVTSALERAATSTPQAEVAPRL